MSYSYKQWTQDQTADNVIHASDLERWQDGITDAGGTWEGSWTDEKDTLTAEQLNALETEIASLYGTGFTAKTWEDGQVPGVDEWNRIEDAINTILNRTAFAIYCETDNSLTFYVDTEVPEAGDTYDGKVVAEVYTGLENTNFSSSGSSYWYSLLPTLSAIVFDKSFSLCKPTSFMRWFTHGSDVTATYTGLEYIDTSKATTFNRMFYNSVSLTSLEPISGWDISSVTNLDYMFYGCSGLTTLEPLASWDTSNVTNLEQIFNGCNNVESIDVSKWNTAKVTNMSYLFQSIAALEKLDLSGWDTSNVTNMNYMFNSCSALKTIYVAEGQFNTDKVTQSTGMFQRCSSIVGGNGTTFDSSKIDSSMAHIDTEDNPGYFTAKG